METLTSNQAKTQFGDLLLKVQRAPVEISRNGKAVAVMLSIEDYAALETLKLQQLQDKIQHALNDINDGKIHDGEALLQSLLDDNNT
ncbi:type II toxin-antitoxin system Phd/YefM family antitoxin [Undibacterium flavidum]|uniref:Antitoxin n=1 Tax=Undibacterium flavidum TaxID=2762297 RepID=A0ABR6YAE1_9BURK|nr:type II toxin-antitoxin system Phd/YefM family antitoxin [Undibacterium flavidum]MBC3873556.1 type II toxin-antitoxin system Phd/YefM family antitoxin [Undibacterium flavidum]